MPGRVVGRVLYGVGGFPETFQIEGVPNIVTPGSAVFAHCCSWHLCRLSAVGVLGTKVRQEHRGWREPAGLESRRDILVWLGVWCGVRLPREPP